jgi:hypothetical protein
MKKLIVIFAILFALTIVGCASTGGKDSKAADAPASAPYSVDLSSVKYAIFSNRGNSLTPARTRTKVLRTAVRNVEPLEQQYDGVVFILPEFPDITKYQRVTVKAKYFNAAGAELRTGNGGAMIVIAYDPEGDLEGPEMGAGPNTPLKEFSFGNTSLSHTDRGARVKLIKNPGAVLIQATIPDVKFFELTEVTFHD